MEKFPIFILNHPYLFSLLFVILTLLIWNIFGNLIGGVRLLTTDEATQLINREGAEVIDIRSKTDFEKGHIINAKNIGLQELPEKINKLRKDKSKGIIFVSCNFLHLLISTNIITYIKSVLSTTNIWHRFASHFWSIP